MKKNFSVFYDGSPNVSEFYLHEVDGRRGEISDHVNNVLVREAIKEILGNFGHRQKMGGGQGGIIFFTSWQDFF